MTNSKGSLPKTTTPTDLVVPFGSDHLWHDADRRTKYPHLDQAAALTLALPAAPGGEYTREQLSGGDCATCGTDNGSDIEMRAHSITLSGHVLRVCPLACPPAAERLPAGVARAEQAIRAALTAAGDPRSTARKLLLAVAEIAEDVDPFCDQSDWSNRERASNSFYAAADALIDETVQRHVEGGQADGLTPAHAASDIQAGLLSAVHLAIARYTRPELFAAPGEECS
ncbi:hypothetical protein OHV05_10100 [Kitasatospora sp. NBC_00070]|uniref:hypothetical protein n=1 Tax=Kitasatospora sp. NBC_00070 TaxID=2975962 RepID=UPI00324D59D7